MGALPGLEGDPMYDLNQKYLRGKGGSMVVFGIKGEPKQVPNLLISSSFFRILPMSVMPRVRRFIQPPRRILS